MVVQQTDNAFTATIQTISDFGHGDQRNVTLWLSLRDGDVILLGNLEHGTRILVDQNLVDDLQALVNLQKEHDGKK